MSGFQIGSWGPGVPGNGILGLHSLWGRWLTGERPVSNSQAALLPGQSVHTAWSPGGWLPDPQDLTWLPLDTVPGYQMPLNQVRRRQGNCGFHAPHVPLPRNLASRKFWFRWWSPHPRKPFTLERKLLHLCKAHLLSNKYGDLRQANNADERVNV